MTKSIEISPDTRNALEEHLNYIATNKHHIVDTYYANPTSKRKDFKEFLKHYTNQIKNILKKSKISKHGKTMIPIALIGSHIKVEDLENHQQFEFKLVSPDEIEGKSNIFKISFMSPMGHSLLLKKVGETVKVEAPGGIFDYEIKSIEFLA